MPLPQRRYTVRTCTCMTKIISEHKGWSMCLKWRQLLIWSSLPGQTHGPGISQDLHIKHRYQVPPIPGEAPGTHWLCMCPFVRESGTSYIPVKYQTRITSSSQIYLHLPNKHTRWEQSGWQANDIKVTYPGPCSNWKSNWHDVNNRITDNLAHEESVCTRPFPGRGLGTSSRLPLTMSDLSRAPWWPLPLNHAVPCHATDSKRLLLPINDALYYCSCIVGVNLPQTPWQSNALHSVSQVCGSATSYRLFQHLNLYTRYGIGYVKDLRMAVNSYLKWWNQWPSPKLQQQDKGQEGLAPRLRTFGMGSGNKTRTAIKN